MSEWISGQGATPVPVQTDRRASRAAFVHAAEAGGFGQRPWFVFETSGEPDARQLTRELAGPGAHVILSVGSPDAAATVADPHSCFDIAEHVARMDGVCVGVAGSHPDLLPEVAALVVNEQLDLDGAAEILAIDDLARDPRVANADPWRCRVVTGLERTR